MLDADEESRKIFKKDYKMLKARGKLDFSSDQQDHGGLPCHVSKT